ncbi:ribonuclease E activity regulator RraA [Suttonella sp. R2A3]|uniref:ribonuclease E activity regulator RraA n=1 Tax=Suttonella sp. R2A3 TaxID=2908648 RepID=UPI001F30DF4F|nr:ribonuclease E activity regulator RraA [Suttonella sp. R2A3]UJF24360.1 ribonuclease E activity regulator RraA [Suttonella sp. R2A3]
MSTIIATADLCDDFEREVQICEPIWHSFGQNIAFHGVIETVKCYEDNSVVKSILAEKNGDGRVLVVDAGASMRRAHLGDNLAQQAVDGGWVGVIVYGLIRDSAIINTLPIGVKALGTHPLKTEKRNEGQRGVALHFAGVQVKSGDYCYADSDGIIFAERALHSD